MDQRFYSLYFAYPCSVDAGVNPVEHAKTILDRIKREEESGGHQAARILRNGLCQSILGVDNFDRLIKNAAEKLKESWGHAVYKDETLMKPDMDDVHGCSKKMRFNGYNGINEGIWPIRVIDEFENERITEVGGFLKCIVDPQDDSIRFLYLCGHGLSEKVVSELHANPADNGTGKSPVWPWVLSSCMETMGESPSMITYSAQKGDIVVFSSGLLTPEWVIKKLRECEADKRNQVKNTIVIVIDACYSGAWKTRIQTCLDEKPLLFTRIILQTSCGENEVSYGRYFTPVFCALQDDKQCKELRRLYDENKIAIDDIELLYEQTPTFSVYQPSQGHSSLELPFYFFRIQNGKGQDKDTDLEFFRFCTKSMAMKVYEASRGIPDQEYAEFFASFSSHSPPKILCFRLKKHKKSGGTPMPLFLIEWKDKKYHIHLHFNKRMESTSVTHIDVDKNPQYVDPATVENPETLEDNVYWSEVDGTKKRINKNSLDWRTHVEPYKEHMVNYFRGFVERHGKQWDDQTSWNMDEALPEDLIRSRSACLQQRLTAKKLQNLANP